MKATCYLLVVLACAVFGQQPARQNGDTFAVQTKGGAQTPESAFRKLYQIAAEMTADPSSGYAPRPGDYPDWPDATAAQKAWVGSVSAYGNQLTVQQRRWLVPCVAHLNAAIDAMERGYRIEISQRGNAPAQLSAKALYAKGRTEFGLCSPTNPVNGDTFASRGGGNPGNGGTPGGGNPGGNPGGDPGGTPGGGGGNGSTAPGNRGGTPGGNSGGGTGRGNDPGLPQTQPVNGKKQACPNPPDWVREYKAEGAEPPLRYYTGFNQGVARCLQNQCTVQNLAIAVWTSAFPQARAMLVISTLPTILDAVVHPPGFSMAADPYDRGKEEGERLCNWALKLSAVRVFRKPVVGAGGKISLPKNFDFYKVVNTIPEWLPKINPTGCARNCGIATVNAVRVFFGQPLEPAPATQRGMTDAQMEAELGSKFVGRPLTDQEMYEYLDKMPEGTVAVISGENLDYSGQPPPPGPITNWKLVPGHFFFGVKANGRFELLSGQTGGAQGGLPGRWSFRASIVGNATNP